MCLKIFETSVLEGNFLRIANPVSDVAGGMAGGLRKCFFFKVVISIFLDLILIKIKTSPHPDPKSHYFEKFTP
jgi:hypothetical protein